MARTHRTTTRQRRPRPWCPDHRRPHRVSARECAHALARRTQDRVIGPHDHPATVPHHHAAQHLEQHDNEFVFTAEGGTWLWRSTFIRRVLKPAVNGNEGRPLSGVRTVPIRPGLTFHGLRHSHKTWLIAGGAPEIAQARRLGHHLPNATSPDPLPHNQSTAPHPAGGRGAMISQASGRHDDRAGESCSRTAPQAHRNMTNKRSPKIKPEQQETRLTSEFARSDGFYLQVELRGLEPLTLTLPGRYSKVSDLHEQRIPWSASAVNCRSAPLCAVA
ncbi:hypothetical protein SAMN04488564_10685 [Lentzea waywayandensis]|uniref:Phage integrase family protein n=1 Tax=Lentzea waywayandensis TaxID=84724 RepID=A0A1I6EWQ3_9PSEU|nr:hypothetical protein SAMN04488564_10685 [Lentzea waywayandensis]